MSVLSVCVSVKHMCQWYVSVLSVCVSVKRMCQCKAYVSVLNAVVVFNVQI